MPPPNLAGLTIGNALQGFWCTVVPGFSVLGFRELPWFRALNASNQIWFYDIDLPGFSALPGFRAPFYGDGQSALNPGTTVPTYVVQPPPRIMPVKWLTFLLVTKNEQVGWIDPHQGTLSPQNNLTGHCFHFQTVNLTNKVKNTKSRTYHSNQFCNLWALWALSKSLSFFCTSQSLHRS